MEENKIKCNSPKAWMLASRPKTLAGAAVPVMVGLSLAYRDVGYGEFLWLPALLCVLFAFVMQIDANLINDYFDFIRGNDSEMRLGPRRACSQGWISVGAMRRAIFVVTVAACFAGLPLVLYGGLEMILVGLLCVVFCFLYTTVMSYLGLGDVLVLAFFGVIPVCVTYYLQTSIVSFETICISVACGLVIDTLLIVNNYRDMDNDIKSGKKTLIVRLGAKRGRAAYLISGLLAVCIGVIFLFKDNILAFALSVVYLYLHYRTYRKMVRINKGKPLNLVLEDTARNIFIYGVLLSIGILLG